MFIPRMLLLPHHILMLDRESVFLEQLNSAPSRWGYYPPIMQELKSLAKAKGLWNLFLPEVSGLTNLEYAPLW